MNANGFSRLASGLTLLALLAGCGRSGPGQPDMGVGPAEERATAMAVASAVREGLPPLSEMPNEETSEGILAPARPKRAAPGLTRGNEAVLSVGTAQTFPAVKAFIVGAKKTLWIEMFEFGGTYGQALVPLLLERAKAGVKITLLLDQTGSGSKIKGIKPFEVSLREAGIDLRFYPSRLRRSGLLWRFNITHRKLLLADETVGMAGGTNFGTTFETTTHDLMVRWRGPVVADLYKEFATEWRTAGGGELPIPAPPAPAGEVEAQVAVTSVPEGRCEIRDAVFKAIDGAQSEILIEQQYIWEDSLEKHLLAALKRGVRVRAMVPGGTKEQATLAALNSDTLHRLQVGGADVRTYYDPEAPVAHLHAKYFAVDDRWVATGSANGDARSLLDHQELDVLSTSPAFVREVRERLFENDWSRMGRPWTYKPLVWYKRPLRSLLELVDYLF